MALTINGSGGITCEEVIALNGWQEIYSYDFSLSNISTATRSSTTYSSINIGSPNIADLIKDYDDARLRLHITRMEYSAYGDLDYSDRMVGIGLGMLTSLKFGLNKINISWKGR